jgi:hypothetical protein
MDQVTPVIEKLVITVQDQDETAEGAVVAEQDDNKESKRKNSTVSGRGQLIVSCCSCLGEGVLVGVQQEASQQTSRRWVSYCAPVQAARAMCALLATP